MVGSREADTAQSGRPGINGAVKRTQDPRQFGFSFDPPKPATHAGELAGLGRRISGDVGRALNEDGRSREEIAGAMSALLGETVTSLMVDAYASPARDKHNISASRWLALMAVTERLDLLDRSLRQIGLAVLDGEEIRLVRIGHLKTTIARLQADLKAEERRARPMEGVE